MSILAIAVLLADIWAIYEVLRSDENNVTKGLWAALIVLLPLVGLILWYLMGPKGSAAATAA